MSFINNLYLEEIDLDSVYEYTEYLVLVNSKYGKTWKLGYFRGIMFISSLGHEVSPINIEKVYLLPNKNI